MGNDAIVKASNLIEEQAVKLGIAMSALRKLKRLSQDGGLTNIEVYRVIQDAQDEMQAYGQDPKDLQG